MVKKEWLDKGFVTEPVDKSINLSKAIRQLCEAIKAVVLAH